MSDTPEEEPTDVGAMIQLAGAGASGLASMALQEPIHAAWAIVGLVAFSGFGQMLSAGRAKKLNDRIEREVGAVRDELNAVADKLDEAYLRSDEACRLAGEWWKTVIQEHRQAKLDAARRILVGNFSAGEPVAFDNDELFFRTLDALNESHLQLLRNMHPNKHHVTFEFQDQMGYVRPIVEHLHRQGLIDYVPDGVAINRIGGGPFNSSPSQREINEAIEKAIRSATEPVGKFKLSSFGVAFTDRIDPSRLSMPDRRFYPARPRPSTDDE